VEVGVMVQIVVSVLWLTRVSGGEGEANGELMGETNIRPQNVLGALTVRNTGIYNFREGAVHIHCVISHTRTRMLSACH
jgi:hypothetical protein